MITISGIIIAKNSEKIIGRCVKSLGFCDEITVIDTGSSDNTREAAKKLGCNVFDYDKKGSYSDWRNFGKEKTKGEFIFYLDTDEEVSEELKKDILELIKDWDDSVGCFAIPRKNIILGKWLKHGGWYPDYVIRLFKKDCLIEWQNLLHERPLYKGRLEYLNSEIVHHKENNLKDMVIKTNKWSEIEGKLMFDAGHPSMTIPRFITAMFREFWFRFVKNLAFLDGGEGIIMGLYQVYSRFISYAKLWELQIKDTNIPIFTNDANDANNTNSKAF